MRKCLLLVAVAAALSAPAAAAGKGAGGEPTAAAGTNFRTTLSATITDDVGYCCGFYYAFKGEGVVPRLGRSVFTGYVELFCGWSWGDPALCEQTTHVAFEAANSKTLSLDGYQAFWVTDAEGKPIDRPYPARSWAASGASTGSGVFERVPAGELAWPGMRFSLTGTLHAT